MQDRFIKRLWHTNRKEFIKEFSILQTINSDGDYEHTYLEKNHKTFELERLSSCHIKEIQCTGLKDKNGKLIYEGDIVKFYSLYGHAIFEIKWNEEFATFGYEDAETDFSELGRLYDEASFVEVIGNIYENKELLEV